MGLSINEIKSGLTILVDGAVFLVLEAQHVKPGKGAAFVRAKLRNLKDSSIQEKTFRGEEKVEPAFVEETRLQFLYSQANTYHFMDQDNFEEITLSEEAVGENKKFLKDALGLIGYFYKDKLLNISLPNFIEFKVVHTEPGIRGDTVKSGNKPAEIETGAIIQVPLFIEDEDIIKVDTRTGEYVERVV